MSLLTGGGESNEEIEEEEEDAEEKKRGAPGKTALRQFRDGVKHGGRDDAKTRLPARFIERP
jgi:hypothetical protein